MELISPRGRGPQAQLIEPAGRLADLRGKTVGLLDNNKPNAAAFLRYVATLLQQQYGVGEVVHVRKTGASKPAPAELVDDMVARTDFVLAAIGDWGSCSACSVHDATEVERRGKPGVAICTDMFQAGARAMAQMRGMPNLSIALVPHPLGVLDDERLQERAQQAIPQVVKILTGA